MAGPCNNPSPRLCRRKATADWSHLCQRAAAALHRRFATDGELSPWAVAQTVAAVLPGSLGEGLLARLEQLGWLTPEAVLPFDILDGPDCAPDFRGGRRELVRLAVFGLPGQGLASRDKHRQDVYQQLCAEIMRSAVDTVSLQHIATRVLNHPDAAADSVLGSMLRSFISEREAALRATVTPEDEHRRREATSKLRRAFDAPARCDFPSGEEVQASSARLQREFDGYLAQFEETRAQKTLAKMRELRRRFPVHLPAADLQQCEEQYDRLLKRAGTYRRQIRDLATQASAAARAGDQMTAAWVIRRLQAIHSLLPMLLSSERLEELRTEISRSGQEHEAQAATRELLDRERTVAAKIKDLAGIIHRFHEIASRFSRTDEVYRRAEVNYRRAVAEIRALDTDWLAGLILQLETLLDDLDDPSGKMQSQLDRFIMSVRSALNRLRHEVRTIQAQQAAPPTPPPVARAEDTPPPASA